MLSPLSGEGVCNDMAVEGWEKGGQKMGIPKQFNSIPMRRAQKEKRCSKSEILTQPLHFTTYSPTYLPYKSNNLPAETELLFIITSILFF